MTSTIQNIFSPDLQSIFGRKYYTEVQSQSCSSNKSWISISDNYKALVNLNLKAQIPNSGIRQYENREIYLPANEKFSSRCLDFVNNKINSFKLFILSYHLLIAIPAVLCN